MSGVAKFALLVLLQKLKNIHVNPALLVWAAVTWPWNPFLQACLSLCQSSNHVLSLLIALDIRLFLLILRPLSSKLFWLVCHMAILVNPTQSIRFAHCAFDVALSPPHFPAHWLPFASFLTYRSSCFGFCLLAAVWDDFFSIDFKRALLFVFFPRPAPNHPILRLAHLFRALLVLIL